MSERENQPATEQHPPELGRSVIVAAGAEAPKAWSAAERVRVDEASLAAEDDALARLDEAWSTRTPLVIELAIEPARLREPESVTAEPWTLDPGLVLVGDRLQFLVWSNSYDARDGGDPVWWWSVKAERLGGAEAIGAPFGSAEGDVLLAGGRAAWVDGGPRWSVPSLPQPVIHAESVEAGSLEAVPDPAPVAADLAADQLAAVGHHGGAVRVIAPAGSGKTRVLTERLRHLIAGLGYERQSLLAVAYNKQAQLELEQRLADVEPRTRTLNSLGYALVTEHRGGRPPVLSEIEVRSVVEEVFPTPRQRRANTDPITPYVEALAAVRLGLRDPAEIEAERDDVAGLADGFDGFRAALAARGALDFDEQVYAALEALLEDGAFRRRAQAAHRHLLVDEFQDLTPAHVLLVRLLAMPALDVFAVGDDDQTIYDHAGADPRFLVHFQRFFPRGEAEALEVNYRCPEPIVEAAGNLLGRNQIRVAKRIRAADGASTDADSISLVAHESSQGADSLVRLVRGWLEEPGARASRIAVLTRVNSLLLAPQIALAAAGVPVRAALDGSILERSGVAATLAWIRIAVEPHDILPRDLELAARRPSRGLPRWAWRWTSRCRSVDDLRRAAKRIDDERVSRRLDELAGDIELVAAAGTDTATTRELIELVRDEVGLGGAMQALDGSKGSQQAASHLDDIEALAQVADLEPEPGSFEPWLQASLASPGHPGGVTLATIHKVKGREWPLVAVFGVTEGILPHRLAADTEAERRVLHVGVTRAGERCAVLGDAERRSPFWVELTEPGPPLAARPPEAEGRAPVRATASAKGRSGPGGRRSGGRSRGAEAGPEPERDAAVERALRDWRRERSQADGVPAYVVLNDRQLVGVAAAEPADATELRACEGIGPARLERYGDEILATIASARA